MRCAGRSRALESERTRPPLSGDEPRPRAGAPWSQTGAALFALLGAPSDDGMRSRSLAFPPYDRHMRDVVWRIAMRIAYRLRLVWWFVRRPAVHGSYVAVWHGGRVLVIQNSYRRLLTFPAGGRTRGESLHEAARRELFEEVSIAAELEQLAYYGEVV